MLKELVAKREEWEDEEDFVPFRYGVNYSDLIESMGFEEILVDLSDQDYQGETFLLVRKVGQYGVMSYGWGSCSGCDAAQAVGSLSEATELRDSLYAGIRWFDTGIELFAWVDDEDAHDLQWYGHDSAFRRFLRELKESRDDYLVEPGDVEAAVISIQTAAQK